MPRRNRTYSLLAAVVVRSWVEFWSGGFVCARVFVRAYVSHLFFFLLGSKLELRKANQKHKEGWSVDI